MRPLLALAGCLLSASCLVLVVAAPGAAGDGGTTQVIQLPDGGTGYRLPDGGIIGSLVEASCAREPAEGVPGTQVYFDGSESQGSPGSEVDEWAWTFGDGSSGSGESTSHVYEKPGNYVAVLVATDSSGASGSVRCAPVTIDAGTPTDAGK
jgi:hypothetical protein